MKISHKDMLKLKRWNTPTIYDGLEIISKNERDGSFFNREKTKYFMPQQGPMAGRAITVISAARGKAGIIIEEILADISDASQRFGAAAKYFVGKKMGVAG